MYAHHGSSSSPTEPLHTELHGLWHRSVPGLRGDLPGYTEHHHRLLSHPHVSLRHMRSHRRHSYRWLEVWGKAICTFVVSKLKDKFFCLGFPNLRITSRYICELRTRTRLSHYPVYITHMHRLLTFFYIIFNVYVCSIWDQALSVPLSFSIYQCLVALHLLIYCPSII